MGLLGKSKEEKLKEERNKHEMQGFKRSKDGLIQCRKDATGIERCEVLPSAFVSGFEAIGRTFEKHTEGYRRK